MIHFTNKQVLEFLAHEFDFNNQHKDTYDDWQKAFEKAVAKCAVDGCFTGLSSGYDSGVLTNELKKQGIKFKTWTLLGGTDSEDVIRERIELLGGEHWIGTMDESEFNRVKEYLTNNIEDVPYVDGGTSILGDRASMGGALMCEEAAKEGRKIYISTQGSDEIIADYALFPGQSTYKGVFPDDLKEWANFKNGCNISYLAKETIVPTAYGIGVVFPFLDIDLVQEFLWLKPELKNRHYKAPLYEYLKRENIPFVEGIKSGFNFITTDEGYNHPFCV